LKLSITEVAEVAEVVAAVGVIISIIYLGYEVRQNTVAVRSTAYQAIHDAEDQFWSDLVSEPGVADLWQRGLEGGVEKLASEDRSRFTVTARRLIYLYQNVHYQNRKGVLDRELWEAWVASLDEFLVYPGFGDVLDEVRPHLSEPFNTLVNDRLNALDPSTAAIGR